MITQATSRATIVVQGVSCGRLMIELYRDKRWTAYGPATRAIAEQYTNNCGLQGPDSTKNYLTGNS